jgi:uncharacterized protein YjbI with pentapeptide repeats
MNQSPNIYDLSAAEKSVSEAASRVEKQWLAFVLTGAVAIMSAANVSDTDVLLGTALKIPLLDISLPLFAYALLTPLLYLGFHCYLLFELFGLNRKVTLYEECLQSAVKTQADRRRLRERLPTFAFIRMYAPQSGGLETLSGLIMITTVVLLPLFTLLTFLLRFLCYHSQLLTWAHRLAFVVDLSMVWLCWLRAANLQATSTQEVKWNLFGNDFVKFYLLSAVLPFVLVGSSFNGEVFDTSWAKFARSYFPMKYILRDSPTAHFSLFRTYIQPEDASRIASSPGRGALKNRDFAGAFLDRLDLSGFDLSGSNLENASLRRTKLMGSNLSKANLRGAWLHSAQLQGAILKEVHLEGAQLASTQMQGANLSGAYLQGAQLYRAHLQAALLLGAHMQGATLDQVDLRGALLLDVDALGIRVRNSNLQAVSFNNADLMGAIFNVEDIENLRGADFSRARLWHSILSLVSLKGKTPTDLPIEAKELKLSFLMPFGARLSRFGRDSSDYDKIIAWSTSTVSHQKTREEIISNISLLRPDAMTKLPGNPKADDVFDGFLRPWIRAQQVALSPDSLRGYRFDAFRTIACRSNRPSSNKGLDPWTPFEDWAGLDTWSAMGWTPGNDDSYFGSPYVADALIQSGQVASLGTRAPEFAKLLMDASACPGAGGITHASKADLLALSAASRPQ